MCQRDAKEQKVVTKLADNLGAIVVDEHSIAVKFMLLVHLTQILIGTDVDNATGIGEYVVQVNTLVGSRCQLILLKWSLLGEKRVES